MSTSWNHGRLARVIPPQYLLQWFVW